MNLATFWFILIAILWSGYFVLEGFDFGVGILLPFLGKSDGERMQDRVKNNFLRESTASRHHK